MDVEVPGLSDLVVGVDDWLIDDDSEFGSVGVGDTIRHYIGVHSREWGYAEDTQPDVTRIGGTTARVTGRVERVDGVFIGFDLVCGAARLWMFNGASLPPSGYVPPIESPPEGAWVTVEGELYIRPWYEVVDGSGMSETDMEVETKWPPSCDWTVLAITEDGTTSHVLRLRAITHLEGR